MGKFLRWTGLTLVGLVVLVVAGVAGFLALGIPVELSRFKAPVEQAASLALGRDVTIDGSVSLAPSLEPTLQIEGVHVANADGWSEPDLMYLGLARLQIAVLPILEGRIEVIEIAVDGFQANLERDADENVNWLIEPRQPKQETAADAPAGEAAEDGPVVSMLEVADLSLDNIEIRFRDTGTGADYLLTFDSIDGSAVEDQPMDLTIEGRVQQSPYAIEMSAGSLAALLRGDRDWPIAMSMSALGARLELDAKVADPALAQGLDATFSLQGDNLEDLEAFIGQDLPPVLGYAFSGRLVEEGVGFRLSDFEGRVGRTGFTGDFAVITSAALPAFEGRLDVPQIDLSAIFEAIESARPEDAPPADAAVDEEADIDPNAPFLTLDVLNAFNGRFDMTVGEVAGAPTTVRAIALQVSVADGILRAPMQAEIADVRFDGTLTLDGADDVPKAAAILTASRTNIGDLALALLDVDGIEGGFEQAEIEFGVAGSSLADLVRSVDFRFSLAEAALSYGNRPGERPVGFTLDAAEMLLPRGEVLQATADGSVLEEDFALAFVGADIVQIVQGETLPMELTASGGGATLVAEGSVTKGETDSVAVSFELKGDRIGGLARWIGVSEDAAVPFQVTGAVAADADTFAVEPFAASVGRTSVTGEYALRQTGSGSLSRLSLSSDMLALDELAGLFPKTDAPQQGATEEDDFEIDVPILPRGIELEDADLDLSLRRISTDALELEDVTLSSRIRGGRVEDSPFGVVIANARLDGSVSLDLTGAVPSATFSVATEEIDIGLFLAELGVIDDLEVSAGRMSLDLALNGATARQMMERSRFDARIADGVWTLRDENLGGALTIGLTEGTVSAAPEQPIVMTLDGDIEGEPVTIRLGTAPLASFAEEKDDLPFGFEVALAGAVLNLDAVADLPVETGALRFRLDLRGESLDRFDGLLEASLPPLGPYAVGGDFTIEQDGYRISDFSLQVGDSRMKGQFALATTGERPRLDVDLTTEVLQLDDFELGDWSPLSEEEEPAETEEDAGPTEEEDLVLAQQKEQVRALLSREVMRSLDASIDLKVDEVLSGTDELGSGTLLTTLQDGRFEVSPLIVNIPGGSVQIDLAYEPLEETVLAAARAQVEQLDYGVLARRIDPESDVGGLISVDINLSSEAESLETIMASANGQLDFAVWPKDLEASLFDLWAVNLVTAVLPSVDSENQSKFNCLIARFKVEDGIMTPEAILVDSTRIQASGNGSVNFKEETVTFTMAPKAKRPQMFSANTPIAVNGSFEEFDVGVAPGGIIGTVVRFTTSPVTTPFLWVFSEPVAEDGAAACAEAWAREPDEMLEEVKGAADPEAVQESQQQ